MKKLVLTFTALSWLGLSLSSFMPFTYAQSATGQQIALVPDIQRYSGLAANSHILDQQIQRLVDNIESEDIRFITQLGDVVHSRGGDIEIPQQWQRTSRVFEMLDKAGVPFSVAYGNHDFDARGESGGSAVLAQENFGASRYQKADWFGGSSPDGFSFYQFFQIEDQPILHINLKFSPDLATLKWAEELVQQHNIPTMISTHAYLTDAGGARGGEGEVSAGREPIGEVIWQYLVSRNDQIFIVFGGHNHAGANVLVPGEYSEDGEYHQTSINAEGREVYEFLSNYQDYPNGGDGWLQLVRFDIDSRKLSVRTYSTLYDKFQTDAQSQFTLDIDFRERWRLDQ